MLFCLLFLCKLCTSGTRRTGYACKLGSRKTCIRLIKIWEGLDVQQWCHRNEKWMLVYLPWCSWCTLLRISFSFLVVYKLFTPTFKRSADQECCILCLTFLLILTLAYLLLPSWLTESYIESHTLFSIYVTFAMKWSALEGVKFVP